jgi:hypothetical protein
MVQTIGTQDRLVDSSWKNQPNSENKGRNRPDDRPGISGNNEVLSMVSNNALLEIFVQPDRPTM